MDFTDILMNCYPFFFIIIMEALKMKRKTIQNAFTRLYNTMDETAKQKVVKISEYLDYFVIFQLLNEKNNEHFQLNEDILTL